MVGRAVAVPVVYKTAGANGELIPAVGISYFQNGAGNGFCFGSQATTTFPFPCCTTDKQDVTGPFFTDISTR